MSGEHISDIIIDEIVAQLVTELQENVAKDDPSYVTLIQGGKTQKNPVIDVNSASVHIGDPEETTDDWIDEVARPGDPLAETWTVSEVGGTFNGTFWWRKGTVQIECFFIKKSVQYNRDKARQVANEIRRRVEHVLGTSFEAFNGLSDGTEQVQLMIPVKSRAREAGGPKQHIWHIKVWWQALTSRT
jgi:hypothetical protein